MVIFRGIWPALVTPSGADNRVNAPVLEKLVEYQLAQGVHGFYVGGTTGEGIFMPVTERKTLLETVMRVINGRVPVIVHVGAIAADDAVDLSRHARDHGAAGFSSVIPPLYENMDSLIAYYKTVAAAAPDIPFMAYLLNPRIDGVAMVKRLVDIPNFGGAKYTGPNMYELRQILDMGGGQWTLFSGMDEQAVYGLMMGATGLIGSTLNFMPKLYIGIADAVREGRYGDAQSLQIRANLIIAAMIEVGFPGALKAMLSDLIGADMGQPRLPALPLTAEKRAALNAKLAELGYASLVRG